MIDNQILETSKQVDDLVDDISKEVSELFDKKVKEANINEKLNSEWASKLSAKLKSNKRLKHAKTIWLICLWLFFSITIVSIIVSVIIICTNHHIYYELLLPSCGLIVLTVVLVVLGNKSIKQINVNVKDNNEIIADLQNKITDQLLPLINTFSYQKIFSLISSKWKTISFNQSFTIDQQQLMSDLFNTMHSMTQKNINDDNFYFSNSKPNHKNFFAPVIAQKSWFTKFSQKFYARQLQKNGFNSGRYVTCCSFLNLLSGQLYNHPFVFYNCLLQDWIIQIYEGRTTVSNGKETEVVTATFPWPKPVWKKTNDTFAFKSNVAPKLSFITTKQNGKLFEKIKVVDPIKNMPMENKNFDKSFSVIRNEEHGYRVVFTPLAQENFVKFLNEFPMDIKKDKTITYTSLLSNDKSTIRCNGISCFEYDLAQFKNTLVKTIKEFVTRLGYCQLPFAATPAYCQEYDLNLKKVHIKNNYPSEIEIEALVNANNLFGLHGETPSIINTEMVKTCKVDKYDVSIAKVNAFSFKMVNKVTTIFSGGTAVPVHYVDYIPIVKFCFAAAVNIGEQIPDKIINERLTIAHGVACHKFDICPNVSEIKRMIKEILAKK